MDNSPLKKLPVELRLRIYELALYRPDAITVANVRNSRGGLDTRAIRDTRGQCAVTLHECRPHRRGLTVFHKNLVSLQTTCKQIRGESMPVFMEINHFKLEGLEMEKVHEPLAAAWLGAMKQWTPHLKSIEIGLGTVGSMYPNRATMPVKHIIEIKQMCKDFNIRPSLTADFMFWSPVDCRLPPPYAGGRPPHAGGRFTVQFDGVDKKATQEVSTEYARRAQIELTKATQHSFSTSSVSLRSIRIKIAGLLTALDESPEWTWDWDRAPPAPPRR